MDRIPALEHLRLLLAVGEEAEAARFVRELRASELDADALLVPVASTLLERDQGELALELANEALEVDERCGPAHQVRIDALAELGEVDAANDAAEEWVDAVPDCTDAHVALSWTRLANYDDEGAAAAAAQARDLDPADAGGWLALAYVSRLAQDWDTLQVYCREALERDPANADARLFLGEALLARGRVQSGVAVLEGLDDPRARSVLRHQRLASGSAWVASGTAAVLAAVGALQGSWTLVVISVTVAALFARRLEGTVADGPRRLARSWIVHPLLLWGVVAVVVCAFMRAGL